MSESYIDNLAEFKKWKQGRGGMTLQEALDTFEDGQVVNAASAAVFLVLSDLLTQLPPTTRLQEVS